MKTINLYEVKIQKASFSNSSEILKLLNSSNNLVGYKGEEFTINEVKDYIKAKVNLVLIAKIKKKIISVLIANIWKEYCYLYLLVVDKNYRRMGMGNTMMNYLEKKSKKEGYLGLIIKESNNEMMNLIKKRGYHKGDKFIYFHKNLK